MVSSLSPPCYKKTSGFISSPENPTCVQATLQSDRDDHMKTSQSALKLQMVTKLSDNDAGGGGGGGGGEE